MPGVRERDDPKASGGRRLKPLSAFALVIVTIFAMVILSNIPLVQDWVNHGCGVGSWCSGPDEFWSGVGAILFVVYMCVFALTVRSK
jgi:hypothetical protein